MDLKLKGKKVILTGGSRGIGRAALELFAAEGCDVAFFSRDQKQMDEAATALRKHGGRVHAAAFDLNDFANYAPWLTRAADTLGGCDIFVPGASSSGARLGGDWNKAFEYDVLGTVRGCEALLPYLEKSAAAAVVVMSSIAALETFIAPSAFNAVKAALLTYSKQLSQAWGEKGIRVNAVSPGPISFPTGNWERIQTSMPDLYRSTAAQIALGRFGTPEDVAQAIVFLASPAASFITGANLVIDGGYTKRVQF